MTIYQFHASGMMSNEKRTLKVFGILLKSKLEDPGQYVQVGGLEQSMLAS